MRGIRYAGVGALGVALVVTSAGWFMEADDGTEERFDSCGFEDGFLVLAYSYGLNEKVSVTLDTRDGMVVSLTSEQGSGETPAVGLGGEARFRVGEPPSEPIRYPDGTVLDCSQG